MSSFTELRRIFEEWRTRLGRIQAILRPPQWDEAQWRQFSQALALMVRQHGASWIVDPTTYWDLRWQLQGGGELICQLEHVSEERTTLVVAQTGGFAASLESGSYTWLWAEFDMHGHFAREPYWVDGTWKEALASLLMPLQHHFGLYLSGPSSTPSSLLLQPGARPNPDSARSGAPLGLGWSASAAWESAFQVEPAITRASPSPEAAESSAASSEPASGFPPPDPEADFSPDALPSHEQPLPAAPAAWSQWR